MAELRGELEQTRKALEAAAAKHAEEMAAQSEGEEMAYLQQQLRRSYQQVLSLQQQVGHVAPQELLAAICLHAHQLPCTAVENAMYAWCCNCTSDGCMCTSMQPI